MARVLLIDDEPAVQLVLQQMLQAGGHSVLMGRIGDALVQDLQSGGYDLVITDIHMPGMDGWAVAKWIAENRPGIPVIAAGGASGDWVQGMEVFRKVLLKPFRRAELLEAVSAALPRGSLSG
jgi:CheY-like chemotaxis protein